MGNRRQSRELTLQVLFQSEFLSENSSNESDTTIDLELNYNQQLNTFRENFSFSNEVWDYSLKLLQGIQKYKMEIDKLINKQSDHWKTTRMGLVDLNILRLSIFELNYLTDVPKKIVINEAIEIAKKYGNTESSKFINGVLDSIKEN